MPPVADDEATSGAPTGQRLDKWLWFARVVKSRTLAAGLVTGGKVRVNRTKIDKPAHVLKIGDVVTVSLGRKVRVLKVVAAGTRRGPAAEAQGLFEDLTPAINPAASGSSAPTAGAQAEGPFRIATATGREPGAGRPTKRDRRLIERLRGRKAMRW